MSIEYYRRRVDELKGEHRAALISVKTEKKESIKADDDLVHAEEAQCVIQDAAQIIQQEAHRMVSGVVSRCLESVFDEPYEFCIEFEKKRGKTEAVLTFVRDGVKLNDPINQSGGGPIDVAAFALRLASMMLMRPPMRRVLILDEPFKNIRGKEYRRRVRNMLESLSEEMGVQFIINVDADAYPEFLLGKVIEVGR